MNNINYRRYRFVPHTKKLTCPSCGRKKRFTPYIDITTGMPVDASRFGRCDRENSCRYNEEPPKGYFDDKGGSTVTQEKLDPRVAQILSEESEIFHSEIPIMEVIESITENPNKISLFRWLCKYYPEVYVRQVFSMYMVGYSWKFHGSPTYWQIDTYGAVRSGKTIGYDENTGCRVKTPYPQVSWAHSVDRKLRETVEDTYVLKQCLFGEHLLRKFNKFSIVESEKTVLICTLEEMIKNNGKLSTLWLACGGLTNITNRLFRVLEGEKVIFFPDKGIAYKQWSERVRALSNSIQVNFLINKGLEDTNLQEGSDIADYIIGLKSK